MLSISDIYAIPGEEQSTKTNNSTQDKQTIQATLKNEITPYKCSACQRAFTKQGYLNRHNCDKTSEQKKKRALECDQCDACFYKPSTLISHKRTHTNERNYLCMICKFPFKYKNNLKSHVQTQHPGLLTSDVYSGCFTSTEEMEQYRNSFLDKKQLKCMTCGASFNSRVQLIQHETEVHHIKGRKLYQCNYPGCNQCYTDKKVFERHKLFEHLPCGWQAKNLSALKKHRKSCPQCENFQNLKTLEPLTVTTIKQSTDDQTALVTDETENTPSEENQSNLLACTDKQPVQNSNLITGFEIVLPPQSVINNQIADKCAKQNWVHWLIIVCPQHLFAITNNLLITEKLINDMNFTNIANIANKIKENILNLEVLFCQFKYIDLIHLKNKNATKISMIYDRFNHIRVILSSNPLGKKDLILDMLKEVETITQFVNEIFEDWQLTLQSENDSSMQNENTDLSENENILLLTNQEFLSPEDESCSASVSDLHSDPEEHVDPL